jgi:hypothetical protein
MRPSPIKRFFHFATQHIESGRQWVERKRLELELARCMSLERALCKQISHDAESLAYMQIRQWIVTAQLERLVQ